MAPDEHYVDHCVDRSDAAMTYGGLGLCLGSRGAARAHLCRSNNHAKSKGHFLQMTCVWVCCRSTVMVSQCAARISHSRSSQEGCCCICLSQSYCDSPVGFSILGSKSTLTKSIPSLSVQPGNQKQLSGTIQLCRAS